MTAFQLPHHKDKPFGSAGPIPDAELLAYIQETCSRSAAWLLDEDIHHRFVDTYREWILTNQTNHFKAFDSFAHGVCMQGTTESFDKFYLFNSHRRFRCFSGEYMYHKLAWRNGFFWKYLEDDELGENDAVVISLPFADTGDKHVLYDSLMKQCIKLGVPVLVDCAYFGICKDVEFDLSYKCITDVTFSLSKTFPVAYARIGMSYSRKDTDDTLFVYGKIHYNNKIGANLGIKYLNQFSPDYISNKYGDKQQEFCNILGVRPSKTVLFGIGGSEWKEYNRGGITNRLSFHKQFIDGLN